MRYLFSILLFFFCSNLFAQAGLNARMEYVFIDGEEKGIYTGGIKLMSGTLKVNQIIEVVDDANKVYKLKITQIKDYESDDYVNEFRGNNKDAFLVMNTLDGKKIPKITGGFTIGNKSITAQNEKAKASKAKSGNVMCKLDNKTWTGAGYINSATYMKNGNAFFKIKSPYLIMAFKASNAPDDRQLTFQFSNLVEGIGKKDYKDFEVLISGAESGLPEKSCMVSNWKNGKANTAHTDFNFEITKWQVKGNKIIVSGKFSGKIYALNILKGLIGKLCDDIEITEGVFTDVEININNDTYAQQEKNLGKFWQEKGTEIDQKVNDMLKKEMEKERRKL